MSRKKSIKSLTDLFNKLHLHHISTSDMGKAHYQDLVERHMKRDKIHAYCDVCNNDHNSIVQIFTQKHSYEHNLKMYRHIQHLHIVPAIKAHHWYGEYGVLVFDKWKGNILDLVKLGTLQHLLSKYKDLLKKIHQANISYGKIDWKNMIYSVQDNKIKVGFIHFDRAIRRTKAMTDDYWAHRIESDNQNLTIIFMQFDEAIKAWQAKNPLPDHLPQSLKLQHIQ